MTPLFRNSEPMQGDNRGQTAWQRERTMPLQPMAHTSNREAFWTYALVFFVVLLIVGVVA